MGTGTKGEVSAELPGEGNSALAMGEKDARERGNLSISGIRIMLGRGKSASFRGNGARKG